MGTDQRIFGEGFLDTFTTPITDSGNRIVESAKLAQVLQIVVHLLIADHRQGQALRKLLVLILVQDLQRE